MDHSWRPRSQPPIQGDICPMCFVSHFPFCPPHPEFNQNPRFQFQPHDDHFFQRPPLDPYYDHRGPAMRPHPPFVDLFGDLPRPWHRNPSLERDPHGNSSSSYDSVGFKRMRVDEVGPGLGPPVYDSFVNSPRVSAQDERRLKLIRDHGAAQNEPLDVGVIKGHDQESGIFRGSLSFYHGKSLNFDESQNNNGLKPLSSHEVYNFYEAGFSDFDRKSTTFHHKPGFNQEEHSSTFGQQSMQTNSIEERLQSRYGQTENNFQKSGRTGYSVGNFTSVEQAGQTRDLAASYGTNLGDRHSPVPHKGDMNPPSNMPQRVPFPIYEAHSQIHPSEPASSKESPFSHPTNWQRMSDSEATYHENNNNFSLGIHNLNNHRSHPYAVHHNIGQKDDLHSHEEPYDTREPFGANFHLRDGTQGPGRHNSLPFSSQYGPPNLEKHGGYLSIPVGTHMASSQAHRSYIGQPPLPPSPPPPLPAEPPGHLLFEAHALSSPPKTSSSLFPIHVSSSATPPSSYAAVPEAQSMRQTYYSNKLRLRDSTGFVNEELQANHQESSKKFLGESQPFPFRHPSSDKPTVVDASHIFKHPHRATRPDHIVVILRGLPGSGKSYLAKMLRDLEVENGANAPRIHSMDEYFMTEVEKVDDTDSARSSASARGKRPVMKKVMEYCYEPEMEEAYRSSMLKTFKKTLDEGVFSFVIVDDRNLRVADFAQFWATAKRSGYEVYLLEAAYMDPAGCAAKNVHGFTLNDIQKMAEQWEEAPSLYLKLDIKPLLHRDDLEENGIQEVDMDTEDGEPAGGASGLEDRNLEVIGRPMHDVVPNDTLKNDERYDAEEDHQTEEIKELRSSKWSNDLDEDDVQGVERTKGNLSSLSGLIQAYGKDGKSIHWGDQGVNRGFSIGGANKANVLSLVIGPGAGYNLKSNPLPEGEEKLMSTPNGGESKHRNMFQERLRAERESFRAVFDKRKHRIGGLGLEEE